MDTTDNHAQRPDLGWSIGGLIFDPEAFDVDEVAPPTAFGNVSDRLLTGLLDRVNGSAPSISREVDRRALLAAVEYWRRHGVEVGAVRHGE